MELIHHNNMLKNDNIYKEIWEQLQLSKMKYTPTQPQYQYHSQWPWDVFRYCVKYNKSCKNERINRPYESIYKHKNEDSVVNTQHYTWILKHEQELIDDNVFVQKMGCEVCIGYSQPFANMPSGHM